MKNRIKVSTSILSSDFSRLGEEIRVCEQAGVDFIHVDVMDGHFVPPITIGDLLVRTIRPITRLPIETHLMVTNPWDQIDRFIEAGADIIKIHAECYGQLRAHCRQEGQFPKEVDAIDPRKARQDLLRIKNAGRKAMLVLNPGTPLCFDELLSDIDGVLIMSVNPGFSGQKFMPEVLPKIRDLRRRFSGDILVDGGINAQTAPLAVEAGANILITASYFFGAIDKNQAVADLKAL